MPDPAAVHDAHAFAATLPSARRIRGRLEDLPLAFAAFQTFPPPHGEALGEALAVLRFAGSGLTAFLEDPEGEAWGTLARARLWAVTWYGRAAPVLAPELRDSFRAAISTPDALPAWAGQAGDTKEAGLCAAWYTVAHLLEAVPTLEDGEAEALLDAVLSALTDLPFPPGLPLPWPPTVHEAQRLEVLPGDRVRLHMGGGEAYAVGRAECALTPLPDGGAFLAVFMGTPDAVTVRLSPQDARQVRRVFGFEYGEGEDGQASPLN
ncbi:hypothetical protein QOL99_02970 [Deinococcus sp. MIMF12]|uniref:Uncharacterized protein n=1 Tax=Deinococcus rhizophilus TaxID=3049544 RepID=A0ABT7JDI8_9DEIO|nr:hypothetical protein [Deinococcus rhizophilus]MDL2343107.1 hypothetical protein [Deinococcus rhizophilus]